MGQTEQKQVRIWINPEVRRLLKTEAARQGRTMTDCLGEAVQEWLTRQYLYEQRDTAWEELSIPDDYQPPDAAA